MKIEKALTSKLEQLDISKVGFGDTFTDHMLICKYQNGAWGESEIVPFGPISFTPALMSLHYGQAVFEGMKAYKDANDEVFLFRPEKNFHRINKSAKRLAIPEVTEEMFLDGLKTLVNLERAWVPKTFGTSLYLRPFIFASEEMITARPSLEYNFIIICSVANAYYSQPLRVKIAEHYSRSAQGGVGFAKAAGNYAGSFLPTQLAKEEGFDQIIWTDDSTHTFLEEAGTMNVMVRINDTLYTPPLSEKILDGVTRNSMLQISKSIEINLVEKPIRVEELYLAHKNGSLKEVFGCGTAVIVNQFSQIGYPKETLDLELLPETESYALRLKQALLNIQFNKAEDPFEWRVKVK